MTPEHIVRLIDEHKENRGRTEKLRAFTRTSDEFKKLPDNYKELLRTQLRLMSGLHLAFIERLKLFGIHDE
ncbi:MAG: crAss001_48 related protein [Alishewanella aestuarii]